MSNLARRYLGRRDDAGSKKGEQRRTKVMRKYLKLLAFAAVALGAIQLISTRDAVAGNDRFKDVISRGVLRVGVQQALRPWGFRNESGQLIGIEVDLAQDVANTLGVKLDLVPIESSNRMQFLQQGKIDIIVGAMADTPERRRIVGMVEPHYFADATGLFAKTGSLKAWEDLRDKPVCSKQGMFYAKLIEQELGAKIVAFTGATEALQGLKADKCVAFVTDEGAIPLLVASGEWGGYGQIGEGRYKSIWSIGVPLEELDGIWGRFMSGMVHKWHASGKMLELLKKWQIAVIPFFNTMHQKLEKDVM